MQEFIDLLRDISGTLQSADPMKERILKTLAGITADAPAPSAGKVLVPIVLTRPMLAVLDEEDWQWEDLLAAAEAVTEGQYNDIAEGTVLRSAIIDTLSRHRMVRMFEMEEDGLGNSYPLIDLLALDGANDIESGRVEIEAIADAVLDAIEAHDPTIAATTSQHPDDVPVDRFSAAM